MRPLTVILAVTLAAPVAFAAGETDATGESGEEVQDSGTGGPDTDDGTDTDDTSALPTSGRLASVLAGESGTSCGCASGRAGGPAVLGLLAGLLAVRRRLSVPR